jgi:hypothetical protein
VRLDVSGTEGPEQVVRWSPVTWPGCPTTAPGGRVRPAHATGPDADGRRARRGLRRLRRRADQRRRPRRLAELAGPRAARLAPATRPGGGGRVVRGVRAAARARAPRPAPPPPSRPPSPARRRSASSG